jgi:hypothetical protein
MVLYDKVMGSYYYVSDKNSDLGYTPIPENEYVQAVFCIAKRAGVKITDDMILDEVEKTNMLNKGYRNNLTVGKKNAKITILKSPALVR